MKKSIPFICILLMPACMLAAAKEPAALAGIDGRKDVTPASAAINAKPPAQMSLLYPRIGR